MSIPNAAAKKPWWQTWKQFSAPGPGRRVTLHVRDLEYRDPSTGAPLIEGLTIGFRSHAITAIVDPSGIRSRALMLVLAGLEAPTAGRLIAAKPRALRMRMAGRIGPVAHIHSGVPLDDTLTVRQNILRPLAATGSVAIWENLVRGLDAAGIRALADSPTEGFDALTRIKVQIARAIACGCETLLLEDPRLTGPDEDELFAVLHRVADEGATVLMATTRVDEAARTDRAVLLANGRAALDIAPVDEAALTSAIEKNPNDPATLIGPVPSAIPPFEGESPSAAEAPVDSAADVPVDSTVDVPVDSTVESDETASAGPEPAADPLREELTALAPPQRVTSPEVDEVIDRARRILSDLPGSVVPED